MKPADEASLAGFISACSTMEANGADWRDVEFVADPMAHIRIGDKFLVFGHGFADRWRPALARFSQSNPDTREAVEALVRVDSRLRELMVSYRPRCNGDTVLPCPNVIAANFLAAMRHSVIEEIGTRDPEESHYKWRAKAAEMHTFFVQTLRHSSDQFDPAKVP